MEERAFGRQVVFGEGVVSCARAMSWELRVRLATVSPGLSLAAIRP